MPDDKKIIQPISGDFDEVAKAMITPATKLSKKINSMTSVTPLTPATPRQGVLENGMSYLTQRGLSEMSGAARSTIQELTRMARYVYRSQKLRQNRDANMRDIQIIQDYHSGLSLSAVGHRHGLSSSRISQILHTHKAAASKADIIHRQRTTQLRNFAIVWNDELDNALRKLRDAGLGNRLIGEIMGFCEPTIAKRVKQLGLPPGIPFKPKHTVGIV